MSPVVVLAIFLVDLSMFFVTLVSASQANKNAEKVLILLRNCPKEDYYDTEVRW